MKNPSQDIKDLAENVTLISEQIKAGFSGTIVDEENLLKTTAKALS